MTKPNNFIHELSIRGLKVVDIAYLFGASSIIGYIIARILSKIFILPFLLDGWKGVETPEDLVDINIKN